MSTEKEISKNEQILEKLSNYELLDLETGELVNVLDESLPVKSRVDSAAWLIEKIEHEMEMSAHRIKLWQQRKKHFEFIKDKIKTAIRDSMITENLKKIKTIENTFSVVEREKEVLKDIATIKDYKYDFTIKGVSYDEMKTFEESFAFLDNSSKMTTVNLGSISADRKEKIKTKHLAIRKSPKSKEGNE